MTARVQSIQKQRRSGASGRGSSEAPENDPGRRALGRPPASEGEQVKKALLAAARQLFLSYQFKAVSVRQIAELAGVNGAMVNYYFGGKRGLYLAMVDEVFLTLEQPLRELSRQRHDSVRDFISAYMGFLAANPWWPNFVIREVLFGEEEIRQSIVEKFSSTFAQGIIGAIESGIQSGRYRSGLQPELASWSLMGMMVFPFLSRPIASHLLSRELNSDAVAELIRHTGELFERGVMGGEES